MEGKLEVLEREGEKVKSIVVTFEEDYKVTVSLEGDVLKFALSKEGSPAILVAEYVVEDPKQVWWANPDEIPENPEEAFKKFYDTEFRIALKDIYLLLPQP
jgi:hypothetical protein